MAKLQSWVSKAYWQAIANYSSGLPPPYSGVGASSTGAASGATPPSYINLINSGFFTLISIILNNIINVK